MAKSIILALVLVALLVAAVSAVPYYGYGYPAYVAYRPAVYTVGHYPVYGGYYGGYLRK